MRAWMDEYQQMIEEAEPSPPRPLAMFGLTPGGSITFTIDDIPPWLLRADPHPLDLIDLSEVRTIVAKHLPEDGTQPKRNWLQRWVTNPEPAEKPGEYLIVGDSIPQHATPDVRDYFPLVETPYVDSFMDHLSKIHLDSVREARRESARQALQTAVLHLEVHLENLPNETMLDTLAHSATHDCINVVREMLDNIERVPSGGA